MWFGNEFSNPADLRKYLTTAIKKDSFILCNFIIDNILGARLGGHIAPISAYCVDSDQFLILEVGKGC